MSIRIHCINTAHIASAGLGATVFYNYDSLTKDLKEKLKHPFYEEMEIRGKKMWGHYSAVPFFYLENAKEKILIETGLNAQNIKEINEAFEARDINQTYWKDPGDDLEKGLSALNIRPEDIDLVVLTHLHFDHFINAPSYKNATFIVQEKEIPLAVTTPAYATFYYKEFSKYLFQISGRLSCIDGDSKIAKGVEVWRVGGHTPGLMVVAVETRLGLVVIGSDLFMCFGNIQYSWPGGALWNVKEALNSINRVKSEADIIIPSHDFSIWEKFPGGIVG